MIILLHVAVALSSIVYAAYAFVAPSETKFKISYALMGGTFLSGTLLILTQPVHILSVCISGLAYLAIVLAATVAAHYRLAIKKTKI